MELQYARGREACGRLQRSLSETHWLAWKGLKFPGDSDSSGHAGFAEDARAAGHGFDHGADYGSVRGADRERENYGDDVERGVDYTTNSNSDGYYRLPTVAVGSYKVRVENAGFQTVTQSNIVCR